MTQPVIDALHFYVLAPKSFWPNISIVSFSMLAVQPLSLAAPNRLLDHSVRFV
jgi:hypothetical protein